MEKAIALLRRKESILQKRITLTLILSSLLLLNVSVADLASDYVEAQATIIQQEADLSVSQKSEAHYKELYKWECIKGTIKDVAIIAAMFAL